MQKNKTSESVCARTYGYESALLQISGYYPSSRAPLLGETDKLAFDDYSEMCLTNQVIVASTTHADSLTNSTNTHFDLIHKTL